MGVGFARRRTLPINMAIVKEGFVAHCPKSTRANGDVECVADQETGAQRHVCKAFLMSNWSRGFSGRAAGRLCRDR
jgi:hypothetical protein